MRAAIHAERCNQRLAQLYLNTHRDQNGDSDDDDDNTVGGEDQEDTEEPSDVTEKQGSSVRPRFVWADDRDPEEMATDDEMEYEPKGSEEAEDGGEQAAKRRVSKYPCALMVMRPVTRSQSSAETNQANDPEAKDDSADPERKAEEPQDDGTGMNNAEVVNSLTAAPGDGGSGGDPSDDEDDAPPSEPEEDTSTSDESYKPVLERGSKEPNVVLTAEQFRELLQNVGRKPEDEEDVPRQRLGRVVRANCRLGITVE